MMQDLADEAKNGRHVTIEEELRLMKHAKRVRSLAEKNRHCTCGAPIPETGSGVLPDGRRLCRACLTRYLENIPARPLRRDEARGGPCVEFFVSLAVVCAIISLPVWRAIVGHPPSADLPLPTDPPTFFSS